MSALYSSSVMGQHFPVRRAGRELNVNTCESPLASIQGFHCRDTHPASLSPGYPPTQPKMPDTAASPRAWGGGGWRGPEGFQDAGEAWTVNPSFLAPQAARIWPEHVKCPGGICPARAVPWALQRKLLPWDRASGQLMGPVQRGVAGTSHRYSAPHLPGSIPPKTAPACPV